MLAIIFSAWVAYKLSKIVYISYVWEKTEGTIVDFPRHTWRCGKGSSKCYTVSVHYRVKNALYHIDSDKIYSIPPKDLLADKVTVYYSPSEPHIASLTGEFGPAVVVKSC